MRIAANKAYCRVCRTALLTRKSLIPMRTSAKSVPRKKRTAATPEKRDGRSVFLIYPWKEKSAFSATLATIWDSHDQALINALISEAGGTRDRHFSQNILFEKEICIHSSRLNI